MDELREMDTYLAAGEAADGDDHNVRFLFERFFVSRESLIVEGLSVSGLTLSKVICRGWKGGVNGGSCVQAEKVSRAKLGPSRYFRLDFSCFVSTFDSAPEVQDRSQWREKVMGPQLRPGESVNWREETRRKQYTKEHVLDW